MFAFGFFDFVVMILCFMGLMVISVIAPILVLATSKLQKFYLEVFNKQLDDMIEGKRSNFNKSQAREEWETKIKGENR
jgi:hypothetical protein